MVEHYRQHNSLLCVFISVLHKPHRSSSVGKFFFQNIYLIKTVAHPCGMLYTNVWGVAHSRVGCCTLPCGVLAGTANGQSIGSSAFGAAVLK